MTTPPDNTYPQYEVQRWRVLPLVPMAEQVLLTLELPYIARTSLGTWRWFGLAPFPHEWAAEAVRRQDDPRRDAQVEEALEGQSERLSYFDPVRRVLSGILGAGDHTFELVRVRVPGHAIAVIERIATWLRFAGASSTRPTTPIELWDNANTSPWPFPIPHPDGGGGQLRAEWLIVRQRVSDTGREPNFVQQGTPGAIPADTIVVGPWDDGRYWWNNSYSGGMKWLTGSRSLLRFFCTISITGPGAWSVEAGGRLSGYTQASGALGANIQTVVSR